MCKLAYRWNEKSLFVMSLKKKRLLQLGKQVSKFHYSKGVDPMTFWHQVETSTTESEEARPS